MTEFQPLVSVIINCFNGETYLREAIDSVVTQTYTNWEIVFWDNQSTDFTADIVKSYRDERIKYYYAPEHTSLGEARNLAIEKANGWYINFLDADDVWLPSKLEKQISLLEPGVSEVIYTRFDIKFEGGNDSDSDMWKYYQRVKQYRPNPKLSTYENLLYRNWMIFSSVLFNKELFLSIGGVNPQFKQNEDYEILLKFSLKTNIRCVEEELVYYRIHAFNNSSKNGMSYIVENRMIFSNLPDSKVLRNAKSLNEVRCAIFYFRNKQYIKAIKHFICYGSLTEFAKLICRKKCLK